MGTLKVDTIQDSGGNTILSSDGSGGFTNSLPAGKSGSFRNLIINGDMSIAQRGTSATSLSSNNYFTVDRWKSIHGVGLGVWTNEQSTDVPTGQGFSYSYKSICTTADPSPSANDIVQVIQEIEGLNMPSLKKGTVNSESVTLSFWVKSNITGTYTVEWRDSDNNRHICAAYTITASDTWEKKTITFAGDTVSAFVHDNSTCGNIGFCYGAGSNFTSGTLATSWASRNTANLGVGQVNVGATINNYFQLTGVQLEIGTTASDFEFLPYDVNLRRCQRYFYIVRGATDGTGFALIGSGFNNGGGATGRVNMILPESMRAVPSISYAGPVYFDGSTQRTITSLGTTIYLGGDNGRFMFDNTLSGSQTQGSGGSVFTDNTTASYMQFNSEL